MSSSRPLAIETLSWGMLAALLALAVPLFIAMPLWVDVTYHDLSARNILWGGIHYRDVFETNLPGMVWLHILVRSLFGWSAEVIRGADLVVVGSAVLLLTSWLARLGVLRIARIWFVFACAFFYLGGSEFIHCQRDGWMLLPAMIALHLRGRQLARSRAPNATAAPLFAFGVMEGLVWGCAVWIKPHVLVPALFVWLASVGRIAGGTARRAWLADLGGLLCGGLMAGLAGSIWLISTGTWPYLWDILLHWNTEYYDWSLAEFQNRFNMVIMYFSPWSLIHIVSIPVALYTLYQARPWRRDESGTDEPLRMDRALLAALYLGWLAQATLLQRVFHYSHAPVLLLALAVLAGRRWPVGPIFLIWSMLGAALHLLAPHWPSLRDGLAAFQEWKPYTYQQLVPQPALFDPERLRLWPRAMREGGTPALWDRLTHYPGIHCVPDWQDLERMAEHLRGMGIKDRELICWYDSTHPLYLQLGIRPGLRFMHVTTALRFEKHWDDIRREVIASGHHYVVSDMAVVRFYYAFGDDPPPGRPYDLPIDFPDVVRDVYPWNQPVLFRVGRYTLHEVRYPIDKIMFPVPKIEK
jgi:hypothetical protein